MCWKGLESISYDDRKKVKGNGNPCNSNLCGLIVSIARRPANEHDRRKIKLIGENICINTDAKSRNRLQKLCVDKINDISMVRSYMRGKTS